MKAAVFLATGFEEIEALTVVDILRRAEIEVATISIQTDCMVEGGHGITVKADACFEEVDFDQTDLLILPGGMPGTVHLGKHQGLKELLQEHADKGKWIGAICAAPKILGEMGLLKGQVATCYPGFENCLEGAILSDEKVMVSSRFITGKGPGAAIEFGLKMVDLFKGAEAAKELRKNMIAD